MALSLTPQTPLVGTALWCVMDAKAAVAPAEVLRKSYDIPGGDAALTLKQFADDSGEQQIVYMIDNVRGEKTNPVTGEFAVGEALDRMLAGTRLVVVQDETTGALLINRSQPAGRTPPTRRAPATSDSPRKQTQTPPAEGLMKTTFLAKLTAALVMIAGPASTAQVAPGTAAVADPTEQATVELSPFVVSADTDVGWLATSSLAGSRLNTPLRDTAASINVLTSEFLADIGAIDLEEAVAYAVNVHETVTREDSTNDNFAMEFFDAGRMNIRGIPATVTRNYFRRPLQTDSYNADRIEENRGPNSILFGIGSAGGLLNTVTKQAVLRREFRRASFTFGSNESYRGTVDLNQPLLKGKLAVRVNAVYGEQGHFRHHIKNDTKRLHLASTWQARPTTRFRVDYEIGEIDQITARGVPPLDGVSRWMTAGSTLLPAPQAASSSLGITRFSTSANRLVYVSSLGSVLNYRGMNRSSTTSSVLLESAYMDRSAAPQADPDLISFSVNQSGPGNKREGNLQNLTLFWEEKLGDRTYVEFAHNWQSNNSDAMINGQSRSENTNLFADPHLFLPNGQPNPYAGEFFFEGDRFNRIINRQTSHTTRATVSHELDFGKWGNYRLAAMGEYEWRSNSRNALIEVWEGAPFNVNPESTANVVFRRTYVVRDKWDTYYLAGPHQTGLIQNAPDPTNPNRQLSSTFVNYSQGSLTHPLEYQRTVLIGGQARYFKQRLVIGAGVRRDELDIKTVTALRDPATNEWTLDHPDIERIKQSFAGTTKTLGVMAHVTRNISLFFNASNSLDLPHPSHRILPDGRPPPAPEAKGHDFGVAVSVLDGRLSARANAYEVDLLNTTGGGFGGTVDNPQVLNNRVLDGLVEAGLITSAVRDARSFTSNQSIRNRMLEGYEFNLTGAITRNWNVTVNYSYTDGYDSEIAPEIKAWAAESVPWMLQWANQEITVGGEQVTIAQEVARWQEAAAQNWLREGDLIMGNRKHKYSAFTRYSFSGGPLNGLFVGAGYRHQSKAPTNFDPNANLQFSNSRWEADLLLGYRIQRDLWLLKRGARVQLNVRNLFDNTDPRITRYNSDGTISRVNIESPRTFRLTTSFEF
jgi:iron complex outermembrane recepter protein